MESVMTPMIRRLTRSTLLLALPAALGACAVVPAGPVYGPGAYGPGVYVAPPPVVIRPAPVYGGYYGGGYGYYGRGWGGGYGRGYGHRW